MSGGAPNARAAAPVPLATLARLVRSEGIGLAVLVQCSGGAILTGFALALGATAPVIGLLAALPLLVKLSQLYLSWRIERAGEWRRSTLRGAAFGRAMLLLAAAIPWLPLPDATKLALLVAALVLSNLGGSVYDVAWLTWMAELIPPALRGVFLGGRTRAMALGGLGAALAAAWLIDRWTDAHPGDLRGYGAAFAVASGAGLLGLLWLRRVPPPRRTVSRATGPTLAEAVRRPARDPAFRPLLAFALAWGVAIGLASPFFMLYLLRDLGVSLTVATGYTALSTLASALASAGWGRLVDHFGTKTVLRAGTLMLSLTPLPWLVAEPDRQWPLVLLHLVSGAGAAAFDLTANALVLRLAPEERRASYLASFNAAYAATQAIAPLVGGAAAALLVRAGVEPGDSLLVLFATASLLRASSTLLLARVHEPDAASVGRMIRVLGRARRRGAPQPLNLVVRHAYPHLARVAEFVAPEAPAPGAAGRVPSDLRGG